jgi:hypothetical protein
MISIQDHCNLVTKKIVGAFEESIPVRSGFSGFFPEETTPTLEVDVEVQRDNDLIAVDVVRFTEGNKNKFSRVSEHKYIPPFFKEDYDFQRDQVYMNTIALGVGLENAQVNAVITQNAFKNVQKNRDKVIRAIRKQQADVLQTGIVTLVNGDNIDYRRKASSIVDIDVAGDYWSVAATAKPLTDIDSPSKDMVAQALTYTLPPTSMMSSDNVNTHPVSFSNGFTPANIPSRFL